MEAAQTQQQQQQQQQQNNNDENNFRYSNAAYGADDSAATPPTTTSVDVGPPQSVEIVANSCNGNATHETKVHDNATTTTTTTTTTCAPEAEQTPDSTTKTQTLASRIAAPLTRANLKRCRKKFARMDLNAEYKHKNSLLSLLGAASSTSELYASNEAALPLYADAGEHTQLLATAKKMQKRIKTTTSPADVLHLEVDKSKTPESMLRGRKARKRMQFLRRSTSRFSSKSAPG